MPLFWAPSIFALFSVIVGVFSAYAVAYRFSCMLSFTLFTCGAIRVDLPILIDSTRSLFIFVVLFISTNIFIFGETYIRHEKQSNPRFWLILTLFVFSILGLILIPNFIAIMLGWDGLGITRFLLVIHYQNRPSLYGGYITIISNRIGDALLIVLVSLFSVNGHWSFFFTYPASDNIALVDQLDAPDYIIISLLCTICYTKRAQIPFNAWLPEAIAAPTPVSALVHSSTLVTAGIYVLIRTYDLWSSWEIAQLGVFGTGIMTILAGGGKASTEPDVKKTIAYSTLSQLGYITAIIGLGFPNIAFFHLVVHALYKATIFISAGATFAYNHHYQTYDNWNTKWFMPIVSLGLIISLLCLNVIPYLAGVYSKELIIDTAINNFIAVHLPGYWYFFVGLLIGGSGLTITYSVRIHRGLVSTNYYAKAYIFLEKPAVRPDIYGQDNNRLIRLPFLCIIIACVTGGRVIRWWIIIPGDIVIVPAWIKLIGFSTLFGGILGATIPCRNVTKGRLNPNVKGCRNKKLGICSTRGQVKPKGYASVRAIPFIKARIGREWGHGHDDVIIWIDRAIIPLYRVLYLSRKFLILIEAGFGEIWIASNNEKGVTDSSKLLRKLHTSYLAHLLRLWSVLILVLFLVW